VSTPESPPPGAVVHDGVEGWTIGGSNDDPALLPAATGLLDRELPDPRFVSDAYLRWAYRENPLGRAVERHQQVPHGDGVRLAAHYANMPRRFRGPDGIRSDGMWSLNAVVHGDHQRARHFTRIGLEIYEEAAAAGRSFVVGVTNEKSTGAVVKYMGWRLIGPLPVRIVQPLGRGRRNMQHIEVDDDWLDSQEFDDLASTIDRQPVDGWSTDYTPDVLRWRLACPDTAYTVHVADDVALVTTKSAFGPIPACVVLKVFPLVAGTATTDATRAIRSATRHHRAAFAVYAGFNGSAQVRGVQPPRRLQPSPLNLIVRHLDPTVDQDALVLDTFEFLDMDAY
jgi:hypothetical protein